MLLVLYFQSIFILSFHLVAEIPWAILDTMRWAKFGTEIGKARSGFSG